MEVPVLETPPATKVHLIGGEKGGVGKSMVARLLAQHFIDQELPWIGFDTDRSHGSLMRFYTDYASPVLVDRYEALDKIIESAVEQPGRRVLVDLAAQTHDPLVKWMDESGVLDMADLSGLVLQYWHVMDAGRSTASASACTTCWCSTSCGATTSACSSARASSTARWGWAPGRCASAAFTTPWCRRSTRATPASGRRATSRAWTARAWG
jgi:hypothetical protein